MALPSTVASRALCKLAESTAGRERTPVYCSDYWFCGVVCDSIRTATLGRVGNTNTNSERILMPGIMLHL